jgi:hypothetical protein
MGNVRERLPVIVDNKVSKKIKQNTNFNPTVFGSNQTLVIFTGILTTI